MAQLNEARDTLAGIHESRRQEAPKQPAPEYRMPLPDECHICGCRPAVTVKVGHNVGYILWWRRYSMKQVLCAECGRFMARKAQAETLVKGWWGLSAFVNIANIVINARALTELAKLPPPSKRDPQVFTPREWPLGSRKVLRRPGPWIATAVFIWLAVSITLGAANGQRDQGLVGGCVAANSTQVWVVSCAEFKCGGDDHARGVRERPLRGE